MVEVTRALASFINELRDVLLFASRRLGLGLSDKELHFWVFGLVGIVLFLLTDLLFRRMSRWTVSAISFVYTATVLLIVVLGIEFQQKITGRGIMDFSDSASRMWGFLAFFAAYAVIRLLVWLGARLRKSIKSGADQA